MKKHLLSIFALSGLLTLGVNAQQIQNGSFEDGTYASTYGTADPVGYGTFNFDAVGGPVSTTLSTTDPFEGSTSAVLTTTTGYSALFGPGNDTIAGYLFARDLYAEQGENDPHTERLQSVSFVFKSDVVGQDSAYVYMELTNDAGDLIGNMFHLIGGQTTTWTEANVPFGYANGDPVDSLYIEIASSGGNPNVEIEPGSVLEIDRIILCKEFAIDFETTIVGGAVDFTSTTSATGNGGAGTLSWDFGDGNTSTDANPAHQYTSDGTYTVGLTVTDSCGNDSTYTENVVIDNVSLSEEELLNTNVYPNPTTGVLNISAAKELSRVVVFNLVGRKVMDVEVSGTESSVDVSALPNGAYLIEMTTAKGALSRKNFVKK